MVGSKVDGRTGWDVKNITTWCLVIFTLMMSGTGLFMVANGIPDWGLPLLFGAIGMSVMVLRKTS